nr:hypothetical protein [Heyndrickxia oleronia]
MSLGLILVEALPKEWNKKKLPVLHIDSMPAEINEYYPVEVELIGSIKHILKQFNQFNIEKRHGNLLETYGKKLNNPITLVRKYLKSLLY